MASLNDIETQIHNIIDMIEHRVISTITGVLPLTFRADGSALMNYRIYGTANGAGVQTEQHGYKILLTISQQGQTDKNYDIYIGDSKLLSDDYVDYESGKIYRWSDITGLSEPLYGIGTYTDSLDLSTGTLTRRIKKLVLTGEESLTVPYVSLRVPIGVYASVIRSSALSVVNSHFQTKYSSEDTQTDKNIYTTRLGTSGNVFWLFVPRAFFSGDINVDNCKTEFKEWLRQQYASGTPVTVWYVLDKPVASTIPVPSGLTGTIEGYLIQDGTPTPETPIYPTANGVKQADGTYTIESAYINPTDPPLPLPAIETFNGENTLDSTETLGEVTIKGKIKEVI